LANRYQLTFTPANEGRRTVVVSVAADGKVATAELTLAGTAVTGGVEQQDPAPTPGADGPPVLGSVPLAAPVPVGGRAMLGIGAGSMFAAMLLVGCTASRPSTQVRLVTATGADHLAGFKANLGQAVERVIVRHDSERRLDARLDAADVHLRPGEFVLVWLLGAALSGLAAAALAGPLLGVLTIAVSAVGANLVLGTRANRRRSRFADQLIEALGIMTSSLRAGRSLPRAIELVASEAPSPTAEQFQRIHFEVRVGRDLTESMRGVAQRMRSDDLEWLAQAVAIHRELGGDLTEILANLAGTNRERRTMHRQIDALSAEARATGWLLLGMPIILFAFSWWRTPDSIRLMLTEPKGRVLLAVAVAGMVAGHLWIRQLVKLRY
jgi:tight adherence protein B